MNKINLNTFFIGCCLLFAITNINAGNLTKKQQKQLEKQGGRDNKTVRFGNEVEEKTFLKDKIIEDEMINEDIKMINPESNYKELKNGHFDTKEEFSKKSLEGISPEGILKEAEKMFQATVKKYNSDNYSNRLSIARYKFGYPFKKCIFVANQFLNSNRDFFNQAMELAKQIYNTRYHAYLQLSNEVSHLSKEDESNMHLYEILEEIRANLISMNASIQNLEQNVAIKNNSEVENKTKESLKRPLEINPDMFDSDINLANENITKKIKRNDGESKENFSLNQFTKQYIEKTQLLLNEAISKYNAQYSDVDRLSVLKDSFIFKLLNFLKSTYQNSDLKKINIEQFISFVNKMHKIGTQTYLGLNNKFNNNTFSTNNGIIKSELNKDIKRDLDLVKSALNDVDDEINLKLGLSYYLIREYKKAEQYLIPLAKKNGNNNSQIYLTYIYEDNREYGEWLKWLLERNKNSNLKKDLFARVIGKKEILKDYFEKNKEKDNYEFYLGVVNYYSGDYESAVESLKKPAGKNNDYAKLYLGSSYLELGDYKESEKWLSQLKGHKDHGKIAESKLKTLQNKLKKQY